MRRTLLTALGVLCAGLSSVAQEKVEMLLWDKNPADTSSVKFEAIRASDFTRDPAITVYIPQNPNGKAIIMCPGGGYGWLAMGHEGHDIAQWFNNQGITYVVLKYRLPQGDFNIPLKDAEQAIRLVRMNSAKWGIDSSKVGIMGASAGGHLASTLATHYSSKETRPDFQVLFYPVITMDPAYTHGGSRENLLGSSPSKELQDRFSNELQVTPDTPKAFIMLSSDDGAVPVKNSINYYSALLGNNVRASMHAYPDGGHGWGYGDGFIYKSQWMEELEKWLREEI
ncbi:alpha/beta hydrolase [uncultured Duncaniella sp.]|uniref:alpha/beta hydrolase n=1 Tax=uncultured Duncaniella sp. TaxID=2768039 RepID=UPI00266FB899|nr:alpha/beta hydrolase [uncultured Duncaniella sp.]